MSFNTKEFSELGKNQFEQALQLSSIVLSSAERLASLQLDLARKMLTDQAQNFKALSEIKDQKALVEFQAGLAQPAIDQAFGVARSVYDAAVQTQTDLAAFVEQQVAQNKQTSLSVLECISKNAPAGSETAIDTLRSLVAQSNSTFETAAKAAKKVGAEIAEAGEIAATKAVKAASAAAAQVKAKVKTTTDAV